jgi:3-methyladenine DNA glycosylase AlkD
VPDPTLPTIRKSIRALSNAEDAVFLQRYFKTGPGDYGEGDRFLGVRVPVLRRLARDARGLSVPNAFELLHSPWHEERLLALLILVDAYERAEPGDRRTIYRGYLANTRYINNWDLVDSSAPRIVGAFVRDNGAVTTLERLARSKSLWERRIAMLATQHFIKHGDFGPTLRIAEMLLGDDQDLIHKAAGWMLREVWQRDETTAETFLRRHRASMPRTMLRYAIEKMPEPRRLGFLGRAGSS